MKIDLGSKAKDIITGFEGIVTAYTHYLTGCDTVAIKPRTLDKDGKVQDPLWVDVNRVKVLGPPDEEVSQILSKKTEFTKVEKGGPQDKPKRFSDI